MYAKLLSPAKQSLSDKVLVDSTIFIDYDRYCEVAISWWEETVSSGVKIFLSEISLMEVYKGIARSSGSRGEKLAEFETRITTMKKERKIHRILPINSSVFRKARELLKDYCLRHTPPQCRGRMEALICDMLIAATALLKSLPVVTLNDKDFEWIKSHGLQVIKPYDPEDCRYKDCRS